MGHFSSMFNGLAKSFTIKKASSLGNCSGREAVEVMAKEAKKSDLILHSSGYINVDGSNNFTSLYSKRGEKGANQDCFIVWEVCLENLEEKQCKKQHSEHNVWGKSHLNKENLRFEVLLGFPLSYIFIATKWHEDEDE